MNQHQAEHNEIEMNNNEEWKQTIPSKMKPLLPKKRILPKLLKIIIRARKYKSRTNT